MRGAHTVGDDGVVPMGEAVSFRLQICSDLFAGAALQHSSRVFAI
jgi:hypothetical protein